jgi:hypothetical protein
MRKSTATSDAPTTGRRLSWDWVFVALVIAFVAIIRIRLINVPFERDEGEYAYTGQLILQGVPPYKLAYTMKMPGVAAAYALIMALFGQTIAGVHLGFLLVNAAAIVLVFLLVRRLFGRIAGVVACASYGVLAVSPTVLGTSAHATHFVVLCALGGILLSLKAIDSGRLWTFFWAGLLFGLSFLMKQPGAAFAVFAAGYLIWTKLRGSRVSWSGVLSRIGLLALGSALPFGVTCLILKATGVFGSFWLWAVSYAQAYGAEVSISDGYMLFKDTAARVIDCLWPLWILAGIGLITLFVDREARRHCVFVVGFLLFSMAAVSAGLHFRNHYFVMLLPAIALLAGVAVSSGARLLGTFVASKTALAIALVVFVAALGYSVAGKSDILFTMTPNQVSRVMYGGNPFPESVEIAKYLREHTTSRDTIAVFGSEPQICFYAGRRSATGIIYTYPLMEAHRYVTSMQDQFIREIERSRPKYLVSVGVQTSWLARPDSVRTVFSWFSNYASRYYKVVGIVDILAEDWTEYYWDDEAAGRSPTSPVFLVVFERKAV